MVGSKYRELTVLESNSCLVWAKTLSTPAWSTKVTNPNPLWASGWGEVGSEGEREREGITDTCWYDTLRGARKSQKFRQTSKLREQLPHLERLVTGSRITIHSFTSPYLQKYSFRPSGNQTRQDRRHRKQVVNKYFNIKKLTKGDGIGGRGVICLLRFVSSNFLHF